MFSFLLVDLNTLAEQLQGVVMSNENIFPKLEIPQTIAAGPGPGNTDARVLAALSLIHISEPTRLLSIG